MSFAVSPIVSEVIYNAYSVNFRVGPGTKRKEPKKKIISQECALARL